MEGTKRGRLQLLLGAVAVGVILLTLFERLMHGGSQQWLVV
jgi:hypothetical protein